MEDYVLEKKFDVVIVGSDQVWRKQYINDQYYTSYFLDFVDSKKTKKIAYAASFGKDAWEGDDDIHVISQLLKDFTAISVREKSGISICKNRFNIENIEHVLDPTLLFNKDFYLSQIISKYDTSSIKSGGFVTYVLDEEEKKKNIIEFVKEKTNLQNIHNLKGFKTSNKIYSVPEWLFSFASADFIVTDSFHGMIFSIIFEKEFIVIGNKSRGLERFYSLLNLLGLKERLIIDDNDLSEKAFNKINFADVNKILNLQKEHSLKFLSISIGGIAAKKLNSRSVND